MITGPHIAAATVERTCAELDVPLPAGYVNAVALGDTLRTNLDEVSNRDAAADLIDAAFAALLAGKNPADDKTVQRLVVTTALQGYELHRQADTRAKQLVGDAVCQYADELAAAWFAATADDGPTLAATAADPVFHGVPNLADMRPAQLVDAQAHQKWISAATASRRLDAAAAGFISLLSATRLNYPNGYAALVLAPTGLDLDTLAEVNRATERGRPSAWTMAQHGITPTLCASLGDFAAACGQLGAEQFAREESLRDAATPARFN